MHLEDVGFDIHSQILQFCSPEDLVNLSTVHTSLRDAAEYVLYTHIYISIRWQYELIARKVTPKSPWTLVEERSLLHTLASNSRKAEMVKALDIDLERRHPIRVLLLLVSKLAEVLETMPNLVDFRIKYGLRSNSSLERTISQVIRGGHFQLHTLYLEDFHDLEGIITDQAHLRLLGIYQTSYIKPPWAKVKRLYRSSRVSPTIFVLHNWDNSLYDGPQITMFPAFYDPQVHQEYQKVATSPRGVKSYRILSGLYFCLLGISEKNGDLLGHIMKVMADNHSSWYRGTTLSIIVYDTSIHKPWRLSNFAQSVPLFDLDVLLFHYPDFEEEVGPLAADLHVCLLKDLGRAWPEVQIILLRSGRITIELRRDRQDNWILRT